MKRGREGEGEGVCESWLNLDEKSVLKQTDTHTHRCLLVDVCVCVCLCVCECVSHTLMDVF